MMSHYLDQPSSGESLHNMARDYKAEAEKYNRIKASSVGGPPIERDPDSVENLLQQVMSQAFDIKEALVNTRNDLLGPWPEGADAKIGHTSGPGLIPKTKEVLYRMLDVQREIREHIVAISKGVR